MTSYRICEAHLQRLQLRSFNWKDLFELFRREGSISPDSKFENPVGKEEDEGIPLTKLNLVLANGNNSTLNDHEAVRGTPRQVDPEDVALWLIAYQNFSTSGRIGKVQWDSVTDYSSSDAPCIPESMLHTLLRGESLMDSIFLNLLSIEDSHDYEHRTMAVWHHRIGKIARPGLDNRFGSCFPKGLRTKRRCLMQLARSWDDSFRSQGLFGFFVRSTDYGFRTRSHLSPL